MLGQTFFVNFLWFPVFWHFFYVFQEFVQGVSGAMPPLPDDEASGNATSVSAYVNRYVSAGRDNALKNIDTALRRCHENLWEDLKMLWLVWIPGHIITFSVPMWLRMPLTHTGSFITFCMISLMRGSTK
jgi:hypothetical protein